MALIVILFVSSSIVANYIYAENSLTSLKLDNMRVIWLLRIATVSTIVGGTLVSFPFVWQSVDIIMVCMAITNLTVILLLSPVVHTITSDYLRQRKPRVRPEFDPRRYPDIRQQLVSDSWSEASCEQHSNHNHRSIQSFLLLKSQ